MEEHLDITPPPIETMTEQEIFALFDKYHFKDDHGHNLLYCEDFILLVKQVAYHRTINTP
jgi:hypothetical protein